MNASTVCVITTIQPPTPSVHALHARLAQHRIPTIVVGDKKGPAQFDLPGTRFVPLAEQQQLPFTLARLLPTGHYVRKNLSYLLAFAAGATAIYETDDDNAPNAAWSPRTARTTARPLHHAGWVNVYRCFTSANIWPRGLPLRHARDTTSYDLRPEQPVESPIQQLLTNVAPDVDAAWRLTVGAEPFAFDPAATQSVHLAPGAWCPFNSQSTWWFRVAFPLMYLPSTCTFRMTDIWRSLVAQRCLWELGQGVTYHPPEVDQERNAHDLTRDFADEVPGYLHNERIAQTLAALHLTPGDTSANLVRCYEALVAASVLAASELDLVGAWVADVERVLAP
jgi:hypothetical protein